ncbi:MAG: PEGA domain-containing protein [Acidobacteriota bacterium]
MRSLVVLAVLARVAVAQAPELTKEFQAGVDAFRLGKLDDAWVHLERAQKLDPKLPGPYRFLAAVAKAQGKWQECLDDARTALALNPQSAEAPETRKLHAECRVGAGKVPYRGELADSAAIAVTSNVPGATVKIGGLVMGGTPMAPRPITAGKLEIDVEKLGWKTKHVEIDAPAGIVTDVDAELDADASQNPESRPPEPKPTKGWLVLPKGSQGVIRSWLLVGHTSTPVPCEGESFGAGQCSDEADDYVLNRRPIDRERIELDPGTHVVVLERPGSDVWRRRVRIVAGEDTRVVLTFVNTDEREGKEHVGLAIVGASGLVLAGGFAFALLSESAANEARDIQRVETARDPTQPISVTGAVEPVRTRAQFDDAVSRSKRDAVISDVMYGAAIAGAAVGAIYLYLGAKERTDVPPPFYVAPTAGGATVGKVVAW